jgi:hypothetical protein
VFEPDPSLANQEVTVFSLAAADGAAERALYVHRTGLVELLWALGPDAGKGDELLLDAQEIAAVVARLARAVARRPYAEISKAGRGRRRFARVDWGFNLEADVSFPEGSRPWTGLKFPGAAPPRARDQHLSASPAGYGHEQLRNRRRGSPASEIAGVLLGEILAANGYYQFTTAVDQAVDSALQLPQLPAPQHALEPGPGEPSDDQVRALNATHEQFRAHGQRVAFRALDKQLDLEGLTLRPLAESMPAGPLLPVVHSRGGFFRDEDQLMVTVAGRRYCEHRAEALDLIARTLGYLAKREKPFVPTDTQRELRVTSAELGKALALTTSQLEQVRLMLEAYEGHATTSAGSDGPAS